MITRLKRRLRIAATIIVSLAGLLGLAFLSTYYYLKPTLPDVAVLRDVRLQVPLRVYSRDGRLLAQIGEQRRVPVAWDQIPPVVVQAVLAAEDDRFFQHPGVDWQGVLRAVVVAATTMELSQGGSTLTQQLVRTTLITKERPPGVDDFLQVFPFFEVQTTWLSWWLENSNGNPVSVTNEAAEDYNAHSRGLAEKTSATARLVTVNTEMHRGNVGLAVIDPIDPLESSVAEAQADYDLFVNASGGGTPPPPTGYTWSGTFSSGVGGVNAADAVLTPGDNTTCARSGTAVSCTTTFGYGGSLVI